MFHVAKRQRDRNGNGQLQIESVRLSDHCSTELRQGVKNGNKSIEDQAEIIGFGSCRSVAGQVGGETAAGQRLALGRDDRAVHFVGMFQIRLC